MKNHGLTGRLEQLDSLRGIAAITVVIYHALNVFGWGYLHNKLILFSPLRFFWLGHQAVIFFFLLSGFVLSIPYFSGNKPTYSSFIIKRICRIYIPYCVAIGFAIFARILFYESRGGSIDAAVIAKHFLLLGSFDQDTFDPVVWSLVHEMRISIIFPLIMYCIVKFPWKINILIGFMLSVLGISLHSLFQDKIDELVNFYDTLHYIFIFIIGAIIAKHRLILISLYEKLRSDIKLIILVVCAFLYMYSNVLNKFNMEGRLVSDWFTAIAGAFFIIFSLQNRKVIRFLHNKVVLFFGKISYSLYLIHLVVFLAISSKMSGKFDGWIVVVISILTALLICVINYNFVEIPSIRLAKLLIKNKKLELKNVTQTSG